MLHFKLGNPVCRGSKNVNENVFGFQNEVSFIEVSRNFVIFDFIQPGNVASLVGKLGLFFGGILLERLLCSLSGKYDKVFSIL